MITTENLLFCIFLAVATITTGTFVVVAFMHYVKIVYLEIVEFLSQYRSERVKCHFDNDHLFTQWVEDFRSEPLNKMREYADAH